MTDTLASFGAEWLKLRKRPAVWVLGAILIALLTSLAYGIPLLAVATMPGGTRLGAGFTADSMKQSLYPAHFLQTTLGGFRGLGSAIALILGVLACGSEYGWSTLKIMFTQRPPRLATFAGKLAAVTLVLAIYDVLAFAATAICSGAVAAGFAAPPGWPGIIDAGKALLVAWLLMGLWAALGMLFAVLFRQSGLAMGLGLVYVIAVEGIILGTLRHYSWMHDVERAFPGANAGALVEAFGSAVPGGIAGAPLVGATQAVLVLIGYLAIFCLLAALLLQRRDVT